MNQPNKNLKNLQVDRQNVQCQQFEQLLNDCLDGRDPMSSLVSNPHLNSCSDCRVSFDVYRQFDRAGGAVLNGGARALPLKQKERSQVAFQRWLPLASIAVAAALMIYMVAPAPNGAPHDQVATSDAVSNLVAENSSTTESDRSSPADEALINLWATNHVNELRSTVGHIREQPILDPLYEVGSISQRLLSSSLVPSIGRDRSRGWEKPWRYTSELPGIRPFHRSVNVALVLYNDSMTVL